MRLLNVQTRQLQLFHENVPPYAILSHTWGDEEILFQELNCPESQKKAGYVKIEKACEVAEGNGLSYIWIDTCCIDKSSSAELSEAINSMFQWYKKSKVCYAHLDDIENSSQLEKARWFTRGWTLQELIAPADLTFFTRNWSPLGTRDELGSTISKITNIDHEAFGNLSVVRSCSIATRMTWAANRRTTRLEDKAYCLLGIFDVNMPLIYGERSKAFIRLQEEIMKQSSEQSLFAWGDFGWRTNESMRRGILATGPESFRCSNIVPIKSYEGPFSITNKGIHIRIPMLKISSRVQYALLACRFHEDNTAHRIGITLEFIHEQGVFIRMGKVLERIDIDTGAKARMTNIFILKQLLPEHHSPRWLRIYAPTPRAFSPSASKDQKIIELPKNIKGCVEPIIYTIEFQHWESGAMLRGTVELTREDNYSARMNIERTLDSKPASLHHMTLLLALPFIIPQLFITTLRRRSCSVWFSSSNGNSGSYQITGCLRWQYYLGQEALVAEIKEGLVILDLMLAPATIFLFNFVILYPFYPVSSTAAFSAAAFCAAASGVAILSFLPAACWGAAFLGGVFLRVAFSTQPLSVSVFLKAVFLRTTFLTPAFSASTFLTGALWSSAYLGPVFLVASVASTPQILLLGPFGPAVLAGACLPALFRTTLGVAAGLATACLGAAYHSPTAYMHLVTVVGFNTGLLIGLMLKIFGAVFRTAPALLAAAFPGSKLWVQLCIIGVLVSANTWVTDNSSLSRLVGLHESTLTVNAIAISVLAGSLYFVSVVLGAIFCHSDGMVPFEAFVEGVLPICIWLGFLSAREILIVLSSECARKEWVEGSCSFLLPWLHSL